MVNMQHRIRTAAATILLSAACFSLYHFIVRPDSKTLESLLFEKSSLHSNLASVLVERRVEILERSLVENDPCATDEACKVYLQPRDRHFYSLCMDKVKAFSKDLPPMDNGCHFINGTKRKPVALVSFPGSGNTWVRQMLEKVTGICTGSDICDMSLRYKGFTGEYVRSGAVLVVKTHSKSPKQDELEKYFLRSNYGSAIVIVRNPMDALVSDYNRYVANGFQDKTVQFGTHTKRVSMDMFGTFKKWTNYLKSHTSKWKKIIQNWIIAGVKHKRMKVLVIKYEDLRRNQTAQVQRMLDFLQIKYSMENLESQLSVHYKDFHRKHEENHNFRHFTNYQKSNIVQMIKSTMDEIKHSNLTSLLDLKEYL